VISVGVFTLINSLINVDENSNNLASIGEIPATLFILTGIALILAELNRQQQKTANIEFYINYIILVTAIASWMLLSRYNLSSSSSIESFLFGEGETLSYSLLQYIHLGFILSSISTISVRNFISNNIFSKIIGFSSSIILLLFSLLFISSHYFYSQHLKDHAFISEEISIIISFMFISLCLFNFNLQSIKANEYKQGKTIVTSINYIWLFLISSIISASAAYLHHAEQSENYYQLTSKKISAIAKLKEYSISSYYQERIGDAKILSKTQWIIAKFKEKELNGTKKGTLLQEKFLNQISLITNNKNLDQILLVDNQGNMIFPQNSNQLPISNKLREQIINGFFKEDKVYLYDFHKNNHSEKIYLALIKPVYDTDSSRLGIFIMRIDPEVFLYPFLREWPIASNSSETLLVRKEGNDVLFLNNLRFKENSALELRHSLDETTLPAVKAVQGSIGIVEGRDYRDIEVVADVRPIRGTPWFMITRMDRSDIYSPLKKQLWLTIALAITLNIILCFAFIFFRHKTRLTFYKNQHETALQLKIYSKIFSQNSEGIIVCDAQGKIILANDAFTKITGYERSEAIGKTPKILSSNTHDKSFYEKMWSEIKTKGIWQGEITNRRKNGDLYPEWLTINTLDMEDSNSPPLTIGIFRDISQYKKSEQDILHLAYYDSLTSLPNRTLLKDRINQLIKNASRNKKSWAILFLDLDRFKLLNDSLGHRIGDLMLVEVAKRLLLALRDEDTACRFGGDEFVILIPDSNEIGATNVAKKILDIFSQPFQLDDTELSISASVGVAIYPTDGSSGEELLQAADTAMYRAKDSGRNNYKFYTPELYARSLRRLEIDSAIRGAIHRQEFELYYQPQFEISSGNIIGCEALLRWHHPKLGSISPAEFIPIAEDNGQILSIDNWVIKTAARQISRWKAAGSVDIPVAINLSAVQFHHKNLISTLKSTLNIYDLPARYLELEITEGLMMEDVKSAVHTIDSLNKLGFAISVDDFGTGYSSLAYLKRFKISTLKIDQSFIHDIATDSEYASIVKMIIGLSDSLGVNTIAEGVETEIQRSLLKEFGCKQVQGFYYSKPLPAKEFEEYVAKYQKGNARAINHAT
jgi:diguanylate cyclase (GGDEF)-like protein/PAS domain S-box-containing protein